MFVICGRGRNLHAMHAIGTQFMVSDRNTRYESNILCTFSFLCVFHCLLYLFIKFLENLLKYSVYCDQRP
jgi:hypothetical protein